MWKHDSGNWQERFKRTPTLIPPSTAVPTSTAGAEPSTQPLRFLDPTFTDAQPLVEFPTLQESAVAGSAPVELSSTPWVAFSGVEGGHVLPLRAHLDMAVGLTTAHYVPFHSEKLGKLVYICFEQVTDAYWMVRKGRMRLHYDQGSTTLLVEPCERDWNSSSSCYSFEVDAFWCTDELFLEKYDRHTWNGSASQVCRKGDSKGENDSSSVLDSFPWTENGRNATAASSRSETSIPDGVSSSSTLSSRSFERKGRAMECAGNVFAITSLAYTPALDNVFSELLRLLLLLVWTFFRAISFVLSGGSSGGVPHSVGQWNTRKLDTSSLSSSPIQYLTHWLAYYIPFAPSVSEVNLCLWTCWHRRSPHSQRSLLQRLEEMQKTSRHFSPKMGADSSDLFSMRISHLPTLFIWNSSFTVTRYSFLVSALYVLLVVWALF